MRMPWEDDINWGNIATTFGKENDMVTTDKVTVAEFAPHIGKTTTDYKENDMGVITRDEVREILEEIIKDQSQINKAENTNDIESRPTATSSTEVPWWIGE